MVIVSRKSVLQHAVMYVSSDYSNQLNSKLLSVGTMANYRILTSTGTPSSIS